LDSLKSVRRPTPARILRIRKSAKPSKKKKIEIENAPNLIPVYQDEVHFQAQATITAAWYKRGSKPQVKSLPGNNKVSYSGFVRPDTGELFVSVPKWFTFETTIESIRKFVRANPIEEGMMFAMILDNAPWHKKAVRLIEDVKNIEYADIRAKVVFVKLPPYSPDLNPIEQVWRITRRENTHNKYFGSKNALKETVDKAFSRWAVPNEQLQSLCSFKRQN